MLLAKYINVFALGIDAPIYCECGTGGVRFDNSRVFLEVLNYDDAMAIGNNTIN